MANPKKLRIWTFGDAHVGTDLKLGRESLRESLRQSEGLVGGAPEIPWDIALNIGDLSGGQWIPDDEEGRLVVEQFSALRHHRREDIYDICGNHDRNGSWQPEAEWFQKWVDPMGVNTRFSGVHAEQRRYPVSGTWERYSFRVGNLLFLMMSDRNDPSRPYGRGLLGGNPGGVVTGETFDWWKHQIESHRDCIVISAHHYMLKNTTVASGPWEGMKKKDDGTWASLYHGYKPTGSPRGASFLNFVGSMEDSESFEGYLANHPGSCALWIGGHTHTHPDDHHGGKSHIETKWGGHFLNTAALTAHHGKTSLPMSRFLTFEEGSDKLRIQCYLHTSDHAPQGWYEPAEKILTLPKPFVAPESKS
ncbi:MAG: hypothetical protein ACK5LK_07165 [Chthoniobacterales bacterium]